MGRYMTGGIVTKIDVKLNGDVKENREKVLEIIKQSFNLKYYDIYENEKNNKIYLYLKEDLVNEKLKSLILELGEIKPIKNFLNYVFDGCSSKTFEEFVKNKLEIKIKKENAKDYNRETNEEIVLKDEFYYEFICDNLNEDGQSIMRAMDTYFENYYYCTDMCKIPFGEDKYYRSDGLNVRLEFLPFYYDWDKTDSECISSTLNIMNHLIRKAFKTELKDLFAFILTE